MLPAIIANACLDGVELREDASVWGLTDDEQSTVTDLALGGRRQSYLYQGAGYPLIGTKIEAKLGWESLREYYAVMEELLSLPSPHELILWRRVFHAWVGNGARDEFYLPRPLAVDVWSGALPGHAAGHVDPIVKVGERIGTTEAGLTYVLQSAEDYAAGAPGAGEVWFLSGGSRFKLEAAPDVGEIVYGRVVPAFSMVKQGRSERQLNSPGREPRELVLLEA